MKPIAFLKVPTMEDKAAFMKDMYAAGFKLGPMTITQALDWLGARPERTMVLMYRDGTTSWMTRGTAVYEFARFVKHGGATYLNSRRQFFDYVKTGYLQ